ncbi:hypothetical protein DQJ40_20830 [Salmonella enterica subsp. enterica serovar Alachua]|uniref:Uncharacterized protein n=1 Tax=Salmonella enterica TaxID=28901 RepID=A0A5T9L5T3_SALER|nr:hypothetical protein [Salmonella enterica subsp. enterica serovar Alachua]EBW7758299.1 hypothetical protein [Salmonella enterica subsp. enterica serovar Alachua]
MTRDRTRFQLSKKGGTRDFKGWYWYRQDSTQLSYFVPAFNHIRRGGSCYSPTTRIRLIWISPTII